MLLRTFKSNRAVNYVIFPLTGLLLWGKTLFNPRVYPFYRGESENLFYAPIEKLFGDFPFLQSLLALFFLVILAFLLQYISNRYNFIRERTMLPLPLFIIFVSGITGMQTLHPVYPGAVFFSWLFSGFLVLSTRLNLILLH